MILELLLLKYGFGLTQVDVNNTGLGGEQAGAVTGNKDARALSGGEKSYATVCLLLSLWESMSSPFRALDEFDVFMVFLDLLQDAINRRLAVKLMVDNAREADNQSQYILITPQELDTLPAGPDIRMLKLKAPERGQTTINWGNNASE